MHFFLKELKKQFLNILDIDKFIYYLNSIKLKMFSNGYIRSIMAIIAVNNLNKLSSKRNKSIF